MSKTTFFIIHFYITQRSYEKIMYVYLLFDLFSDENCIISTFFKTTDFDRLKRNMSDATILFLMSLLTALT